MIRVSTPSNCSVALLTEPNGVITSLSTNKGSWTGGHVCDSGFINGYDLKSESENGPRDNTAANALRLYCIDQTDYLEAPGNKWGHWLGPVHCRQGMAVCGIMTRVQENQGVITDDTALNDVRFLCCDLPA
ncbi:vitelline membrane outer layer protein 1 homolog [Homarus americanus]|uniref:Vitelline membrane outer layer protein 1-like 6 n=1 Tax=Homarus americanus TaxID=6706 RepID=A0A8J5JNQ4_HOMAM|nr:vitelline membrane outer layer protein 1 homolog [Homarus americanus]KAG7161747.1 Vitelline membrane outer layer protein 1-like 6 [Homarus americanus]